MQPSNFFHSEIFKAVILALVTILIIVFIFALGVIVGLKRANFSFRWAESYHKNFGGPEEGFFGPMMNEMMGREFISANGVFGKIIKVDGQNITVQGRDGVERIVLVTEDTTIRCQLDDEDISDLLVGDDIVVVGEPNTNGQIEAQLIRVMPAIMPQRFIFRIQTNPKMKAMPPL